MKAEDTEMSDDEVRAELRKYFTEEQMLMPEETHDVVCGVIAIVRKQQAEISFKAGIKEVVDWIKENEPRTCFLSEQIKAREKWQNQLKEWGL